MKHSSSVQKYICPVCGSICGQAHTLKEHFRDVHKQKIDIDDAKKAIDTNDHQIDNHGVQPKIEPQIKRKKLPLLACIHCGQECTGSSNLKRHIKNYHSNGNVGMEKMAGSQKKSRTNRKYTKNLPQKLTSKKRKDGDESAASQTSISKRPRYIVPVKSKRVVRMQSNLSVFSDPGLIPANYSTQKPLSMPSSTVTKQSNVENDSPANSLAILSTISL